MKTLKISALALAFAGLAFTANAQTKTTTTNGPAVPRISIGADGGITTGNAHNLYGAAFGGSAELEYPILSNLSVLVNAGYSNLSGKDAVRLNVVGPNGATTVIRNIPDVHLLPVKAGLKFYPVSNFYVQGEAGASFLLNKDDAGYTKSTAFVYAPQVGYVFALGGKNYLDAGVRYEATSKLADADNSKINFVGLRVAYAFGL